MPVYTIDCYWTMYARLRIEANSVEVASRRAQRTSSR